MLGTGILTPAGEQVCAAFRAIRPPSASSTRYIAMPGTIDDMNFCGNAASAGVCRTSDVLAWVTPKCTAIC
jgi:hypothetical protein